MGEVNIRSDKHSIDCNGQVTDDKIIGRCYPTEKMPSGLGDKLLLRLLACKIGFQHTANFPKRAFQFGSQIANGKENANDVSNRL